MNATTFARWLVTSTLVSALLAGCGAAPDAVDPSSTSPADSANPEPTVWSARTPAALEVLEGSGDEGQAAPAGSLPQVKPSKRPAAQ